MKTLAQITCLLCLAVLPSVGCTSRTAVPPESVRLIYMGNLDGELEPCGCTEEGDLGGILRQTEIIDQFRARHPELFMVHSGGLFNSAIATDRITSQFILSGMAEQGLDAIGLQWKDLAYGTEFIAASGLPIVASNWPDKRYATERRIKRGGTTLAFFQWLDPEQSPYREMKGNHFPVDTTTGALERALRSARADGALTVLSTTLPRPEASARLPVALADIVILQSNYEMYGEPVMENGTLYLQPGSRGQRLALIEVQRNAAGRITGAHQQVVNLPSKVANAERLRAWYEAFTDALKADYKERVATRKARAAEPSPYAGDAACGSCHTDAYKIWKSSRHARAFATLERVDKAFDANCLGCHTVAFNQPGGFVDPQITADRLNVQCEVCHGPGQDHIASSGTAPLLKPVRPDKLVCLDCHNRSHSPLFDFEQYWPRIQHGLDQTTAVH